MKTTNKKKISKSKMTHPIQGNPNNINKRLLIRNSRDQRTMDDKFKVLKVKNC